ncbi:hypothetical protein [Bacillus sp. EB600]|uniref:hypothetical protein n=1 Tax=Bacillus sp. EB600 TaxID=2806345 RepID=UPI00210BCA15|nr:hypothetical protein [Bacillus sp. EB600]MCQ6282161.1 hypothetical protein [Bacillus sp. EB600]
MIVIHFFENKTLVLSQLLRRIPSMDEDIKIKGRKAKVLSVKKIEENLIHVQVIFEQVVKNKQIVKESIKKKR